LHIEVIEPLTAVLGKGPFSAWPGQDSNGGGSEGARNSGFPGVNMNPNPGIPCKALECRVVRLRDQVGEWMKKT